MSVETVKGIIISSALQELPPYVSPQWVEALEVVWPQVEATLSKVIDEVVKVRVEARTVEIRDERPELD